MGKGPLRTVIAGILNRGCRAASDVPLVVQVAVLLRNQCNMTINYRFAKGWDLEETGEAWLSDVVSPEARTFIDVGANVGEWTAKALSFGTRGKCFIAIEPGSLTYETVAKRFKDVPEVTTLQAAVSNEPGAATFYESAQNSQLSSLASEVVSGKTTPVTVRLLTLDDLVSKLGWPMVDFLKVDTEGYDLQVLEGAKSLIAQKRIGVIQFEYNDHWRFAGGTLAKACRLFRESRYELVVLRRDGLYRFDYAKYGDFFGYANFVAFPAGEKPNLRLRVKGAL